jgi:hypothetical protein
LYGRVGFDPLELLGSRLGELVAAKAPVGG